MKNSHVSRPTSRTIKKKTNAQKRRRFRQNQRRIQKLLTHEYRGFDEPILVESSFAETTREGRGLRQVTLGLTKTNLIIAADWFQDSKNYLCPGKVDPSIECFELVSVFPLKYLRLSVFHRRNRRTLKARFVISGKVRYYELTEARSSPSWTRWCNEIQNIVTQRVSRSSVSETSAGSSSSISSIYPLPGQDQIGRTGRPSRPIWSYYGQQGNLVWPDKDVYLGKSYQELQNGNYRSLPSKLAESNLEEIRFQLGLRLPRQSRQSWPKYETCAEAARHAAIARSEIPRKLNRFGSGVDENCVSKLYLKPIHEKVSVPVDGATALEGNHFLNLIEESVVLWESRFRRPRKTRRRYGIALVAHFLSGFGPWSIEPGDRGMVLSRRTFSSVDLRRQSTDPEMFLSLSKKQLTSSISCDDLTARWNDGPDVSSRARVILFWTPDFWYRPKAAITAYREVRRHLYLVRKYLSEKERLGRDANQSFFARKKKNRWANVEKREDKPSFLMKRIFAVNGSTKKVNRRKGHQKPDDGTGMAQLRKLLRLNIKITAWDLDSNTLSRQMTLIDRDLFVRIPVAEVEKLVYERCSRSAPNFAAWVAFSHRISCLVANEIVSTKRLDLRARLISRLVIAADKCFSMGNFQSCRSILAGLQSPAVFRLNRTWACVRKYYSTKYETMEKLCATFRSPRLKLYKDTWDRCEQNSPCIPYVEDLLCRLLTLNKEMYDEYAKIKKLGAWKKVFNYRNDTKEVRFDKPGFIKQVFSSVFTIKRCKNQGIPWIPKQRFLVTSALNRWRACVLMSKIQRGDIGDPRKLIVHRVSRWLKKCQQLAQGYNFPGHALAWEYLLKARYKEEKDNFYASLRIEPAFCY